MAISNSQNVGADRKGAVRLNEVILDVQERLGRQTEALKPHSQQIPGQFGLMLVERIRDLITG